MKSFDSLDRRIHAEVIAAVNEAASMRGQSSEALWREVHSRIRNTPEYARLPEELISDEAIRFIQQVYDEWPQPTQLCANARLHLAEDHNIHSKMSKITKVSQNGSDISVVQIEGNGRMFQIKYQRQYGKDRLLECVEASI